MEKLKQTTNVKQAWVTVALVLGVSLLFGWIVLPQIRPGSGMAGKPAPDFTLEVISGGEPGSRIKLSDLRGKAVVLDFWASWCIPCKEQVPIIDGFARAYEGKDVVVVGVNTSDDRADALGFLKGRNLGYPSVLDADGRVAMAYGVRGLPTLLVLDRQGRITEVRTGVVPRRELEALVGKALGG
jgi:cytochrome c biogenesis protein CcmG, thiol:disulfide interchange protein DsbE